MSTAVERVWVCVCVCACTCSIVLSNHSSRWKTPLCITWTSLEHMRKWKPGKDRSSHFSVLVSLRQSRVCECFPASRAESLQRKEKTVPWWIAQLKATFQTTVHSVFFPVAVSTLFSISLSFNFLKKLSPLSDILIACSVDRTSFQDRLSYLHNTK